MRYIVDTHTLVWFLDGDSKLGKNAREAMKREEATLIIPSIVLAETKYLLEKHNLSLSFGQVLEAIESDDRCIVYPLDMQVIEHLSTEFDIHDGIIVGTASLFSTVGEKDIWVITKDKAIVQSAKVTVLW